MEDLVCLLGLVHLKVIINVIDRFRCCLKGIIVLLASKTTPILCALYYFSRHY